MKTTTRYDRDNMLVVHEATGVVTALEVAEVMRHRSADPRFIRGMSILWDASGVDMSRLDRKEYDRFIGQLASGKYYAEISKTAVVASSDLQFGMMRMFEMTEDSEIRPLRIFRTYTEALKWLEVSP